MAVAELNPKIIASTGRTDAEINTYVVKLPDGSYKSAGVPKSVRQEASRFAEENPDLTAEDLASARGRVESAQIAKYVVENGKVLKDPKDWPFPWPYFY